MRDRTYSWVGSNELLCEIMETITKYKAVDGSEWNTKDEALSRELMVDDVATAMRVLTDYPTELNWDGYVQQNKESILECATLLFKVANTEGVLKWWVDGQLKDHGKTAQDLIEGCHPSLFGRMLDGGHAPLSRAYSRLCCIDDSFREWNQPYFAMNPNEGKQVCVG